MAVGFYGKLPSHGDFLQRGVSDLFVNQWDAWLQDGIAQSRRDLGEAWLEVFLTSPVWRFALASGVVGAPVWAGIVLPSVDRVGRYFPLTIVAELAPGVLPFELSVAGNGWFDWAEAVARRVLDEELADLDRLEADLRDSDALLESGRSGGTPPALEVLADADAPLWLFALAPDGDMGRFFARFAAGLAANAREPLALWWSVGSERVTPSVLMTRGLPPASAFGELLGGGTRRAAELPGAGIPAADELLGTGTAVAEELFGEDTPPIDDLLADTVAGPANWPPILAADAHSAAVSDVGRWRDENQDSFVERADDGVWLVADGMGGHQGGAMASQTVADHVRRAPLEGDTEAVAAAVAAAIVAANAELRRRARENPGFDGGSTVVALCIRGREGAALWAGDSRLYRLRAGGLVQLTRDHSVAEEGGNASDDPCMITRAVGGTDVLALEQIRFGLEPGDRFLLCSDGVYGDMTPAEISERLSAPDCAAAATGLVALSLERGGADNATAVVVAVGEAPG